MRQSLKEQAIVNAIASIVGRKTVEEIMDYLDGLGLLAIDTRELKMQLTRDAIRIYRRRCDVSRDPAMDLLNLTEEIRDEETGETVRRQYYKPARSCTVEEAV